jgi:hypothetical protein
VPPYVSIYIINLFVIRGHEKNEIAEEKKQGNLPDNTVPVTIQQAKLKKIFIQ